MLMSTLYYHIGTIGALRITFGEMSISNTLLNAAVATKAATRYDTSILHN